MWNPFGDRDAHAPVIGAALIKRGIVLFWAVWLTVVVAGNVAAELKAFGVLPVVWPLSSGNYSAIVKQTGVYDVPQWIARILLAGIILWEAVSCLLFWRAFRRYAANSRQRLRAAYTAVASLLALFGTFILADEVLHAFKIEGDHRGIALLLLASLLTVQLLPEPAS